MFDKDGGATVLDVAKKKQDEKLLTRIRGHDLFACEAKFHESCRMGYVQDPAKWRSKNEDNIKETRIHGIVSQHRIQWCL